MRHLTRARADAEQRRQDYYQLRLAGAPPVDAAQAVGVSDPETRKRYERWFQVTQLGNAEGAERTGRRFDPGNPGRASGSP